MMNDKMFLTKIYNALCRVHTNGEDSFIMVDCLRALQNYIQAQQDDNTQLTKEE